MHAVASHVKHNKRSGEKSNDGGGHDDDEFRCVDDDTRQRQQFVRRFLPL